MRNIQKSLILTAALLALSLPAHAAKTPASGADQAASQSYAGTIGAKAGTGILNTATGFVEIPKTMITTSQNEGIAVGLTAGFFKGLANMLGRTVMGVVDLVTFPIPTKPMVQPTTIFQDFDQETSFNNAWEMYETR